MTDTDDQLDLALRIASAEYVSEDAADTIRALVERVRAAEADLNERIIANQVIARREAAGIDERDSARAKLDTVRALADEPSPDNDWGWGYDAAMADVLAILDGKDTK